MAEKPVTLETVTNLTFRARTAVLAALQRFEDGDETEIDEELFLRCLGAAAAQVSAAYLAPFATTDAISERFVELFRVDLANKREEWAAFNKKPPRAAGVH